MQVVSNSTMVSLKKTVCHLSELAKHILFVTTGHKNAYRNDPKFLDRYAWANSADPDQTAPGGAV